MHVIRPKPPYRQAALRLTLALICCIGVLTKLSFTAYAADDQPSGDTELSTDTAPSDPTEAPPPVVEEPTDIPVVEEPTETPTVEPVPEEPTVYPTDIPEEEPTALPTDKPAATATEAPSATSTDSPTPSPTPTTVPAIPFDPTLDCKRIEGGLAAIAGDPGRGWLDCTMSWRTAHVEKVHVDAAAQSAGWSVIVVERDALNDQAKLDAASGKRDLTDSNPDDADFLTARFYVGSTLGCASISSTAIQVTLTATSSNPDTTVAGKSVESIAETLTESGAYPAPPSVAIVSAGFSPVDASGGGPLFSNGTITFNFDGAPATCGWAATISFTDFVSGDYTIPAANLMAFQVYGDAGLTVSNADGVVVVASPRDFPSASSGTVSVDVQLALGIFMARGNFQTTVTVEAEALS